MGSGKTSVARKLAIWEHLSCIDMDKYIERQSGLSISEIFARYGEQGFRQMESDFLATMPGRERTVLSCGGGIVTREANRKILPTLGTVIYLQVSVQSALKRISKPQSRPLLGDAQSSAALLASREELYRQVADICIDTNGKSIAKVIHLVIAALQERDIL
jgi:shikimate kinase